MTTATLAAATAVTRSGVTVSGAFAAASVDDKFANNGKQYLLVANSDSGAHVLTFVSNGVVTDSAGDLAIADPTVSVAAGATLLIGPFKPSIFNSADGYVNYTIPAATGMTVKVLQMDTVLNQ